MVIEFRLMLEVPVLVMVKVWSALVDPTVWLAKVNDVGLMLTVAVLATTVGAHGEEAARSGHQKGHAHF